MQYNMRAYGKYATGSKHPIRKDVYTSCGGECMSVWDVIQHRDRVYVEVCPIVQDMRDDWNADILELLKPVLAEVGLAVTSWDGYIGGTNTGGCFVVLK